MIRKGPPSVDDGGTILPLIAVLILVLFGFAAFAVDASAAFAEKRQAQSAADAAVMAGALEYLGTTSPTTAEIVASVKKFAAINAPGIPPTDADWFACDDPNRPGTYTPLADGSGSVMKCISLKQSNGSPSLLRVRLPNWDMPTSFASLIGFDTVAISATATAELLYIDGNNVLPFSLNNNPSTNECLATPPSGQLPPPQPGFIADLPCTGPQQGNFGPIDVNFYGAGDPHFNEAVSCTIGDPPTNNNSNYAKTGERFKHNLSIGVDHNIVAHPDPGSLTPGNDWTNSNDQTVKDDCDNANEDDQPYVLKTITGSKVTDSNRWLEIGLVGANPSPFNPSAVGRLRQLSTKTATVSSASESLQVNFTGGSSPPYDLDNVGLWEYLNFADLSNTTQCKKSMFTDLSGKQLTEQMKKCVKSGEADFISDIGDSKRFALVPMLNYESGVQAGTKWWPIVEMRPVYLQTVWYACEKGQAEFQLCRWQNDDADPTDISTWTTLFNPGEGSQGPCALSAGDYSKCTTPQAGSKLRLEGLTAFVLDWDWVPLSLKNQLGGNAPFEVFLHDNE